MSDPIFLQDYAENLEELKGADRGTISALTNIAMEHPQDAQSILRLITSRIIGGPLQFRLATFYLLDSLAKNGGEFWIARITPILKNLFLETYQQLPDQQAKLDHLLNSWNGFFAPELLQDIRIGLDRNSVMNNFLNQLPTEELQNVYSQLNRSVSPSQNYTPTPSFPPPQRTTPSPPPETFKRRSTIRTRPRLPKIDLESLPTNAVFVSIPAGRSNRTQEVPAYIFLFEVDRVACSKCCMRFEDEDEHESFRTHHPHEKETNQESLSDIGDLRGWETQETMWIDRYKPEPPRTEDQTEEIQHKMVCEVPFDREQRSCSHCGEQFEVKSRSSGKVFLDCVVALDPHCTPKSLLSNDHTDKSRFYFNTSPSYPSSTEKGLIGSEGGFSKIKRQGTSEQKPRLYHLACWQELIKNSID
ncbi:hypothetical protein BLNAU_13096 [Blattamonas nauphoetae]|uniref:CID domain-containing protein n=1 Tax=Blattamonas nauphoetae TaxID=2049346 RepID=A0ABQ9XHS6_9EUKA|nr:hypothetical protein BLNAU_13096 [Blattamonas nauphoetae]